MTKARISSFIFGLLLLTHESYTHGGYSHASVSEVSDSAADPVVHSMDVESSPVEAERAPIRPAPSSRPILLNTRLERIAMGSCNMQRFSQEYWNTILAQKPELWIWMGDIIYSDFLTVSLRKAEYNRLKNETPYAIFRQNSMVIGTWDDHDFGKNNSDSSLPDKKENQKLLLDFLDEPQDSLRRQQQGVYTSYFFGAEGRLVQIVLLDDRYFRERPGPRAAFLGEAQWAWLERELLTPITPAPELTLVVSGSQVLASEHPHDRWSQYPAEYLRLKKLLQQSSRRVLLMSGDRHFSEVTRSEWNEPRALWDYTVSGLTHSSPSRAEELNSRRVGRAVTSKNFGMLRLNWSQTPVGVTLENWSTEGDLLESWDLPY